MSQPKVNVKACGGGADDSCDTGSGVGQPASYYSTRHPCFSICQTGNILPDIDDPVCTQCEGGGKTAHGKAWERPVGHMVAMDIANNDKKSAKKLWDAWQASESPTDIHDIDFKKHMGLSQLSENITTKYGEGVSIKLIQQGGEICMADFKRIYDNFNNQWSMVVGFWVAKQKGNQWCRCIVEAYLIKFNPPDFDVFIGVAGDGIDKAAVIDNLRGLLVQT